MRNYVTYYNPFFDSFFLSERKKERSNMMATDIKEREKYYVMKVELPDVKKENVKLSLLDGYLKIEASIVDEDEGEYLYKERRYGEFSRSYFVGKDVKLNDINAKLENGVLSIKINKVEPAKEENHYISIN